MLTLSICVPAKTLTFRLLWLKRDLMVMSPRYREIRAKVGGGMDACFVCGHAFADGEAFALACVEGRGNKTLCQSCADKTTNNA